MREGAINLDDLLSEIEVTPIEVPELPDVTATRPESHDLFAPQERKAWKQLNAEEARCDFAPNKVRISYRFPSFGIISLWKKSVYGRTLTDIKSDPDMIETFAAGVSNLIRQILGHSLPAGSWCIVTSPKRRHKTRNFASLVSARIGELLGIHFYEDLAQCHSRQRVGATFELLRPPPPERNIIVFDDFVTTGSTMLSMKELLQPLGYTLVFFTGISNKL